MAFLISKIDFPAYVNFTTNVEDRVINLHIQKAQEFDFQPIVPALFYTDIAEVPSPADELYAFRITYVTPLLVLFAYKRFLLWAGRQITQFGLRSINEETSVEISDSARAALISSIQTEINVYLIIFWNELKRVDYTFDTVKYDFDCKDKKPRIRIKSI